MRVALEQVGRHDRRLVLRSHGHQLTIGAFLTQDERLELARALEAALREHRAGAPAAPSLRPDGSDQEADGPPVSPRSQNSPVMICTPSRRICGRACSLAACWPLPRWACDTQIVGRPSRSVKQ